MTQPVPTPTNVTIFLFIISFLLTIVIGLVAFIGSGINKRFEAVFETFKEYRTEKVCKILRQVDEERNHKRDEDVNNLGKKVGKIEKSS